MYLGTDIKWENVLGCSASVGNCSIDSDVNEGIKGNITVNGITFERGIFTLSPTMMTFSLDKKYSLFKACVGQPEDNDPNCSNEKGKIKFQVLGDGVPFKLNEKSWITNDVERNATCMRFGVGHLSMLELRSQHKSHAQPCRLSVWADAALFPKGILILRQSDFNCKMQNMSRKNILA